MGSLAAGLPDGIEAVTGLSPRAAMQAMFVLYALLAAGAAIAYRGLPKALESGAAKPRVPLGPSKKIVYVLAAHPTGEDESTERERKPAALVHLQQAGSEEGRVDEEEESRRRDAQREVADR